MNTTAAALGRTSGQCGVLGVHHVKLVGQPHGDDKGAQDRAGQGEDCVGEGPHARAPVSQHSVEGGPHDPQEHGAWAEEVIRVD